MRPKPKRMSAVDYLLAEDGNPVRHEYVDGELFAMSGASLRHNQLVSNLLGLVWQARAGHGCLILAAAMKVRVEARNCFYYPDVVGSCDPRDRDESYLARPCFVIEVLSPSTASIDRREKRLAYRTLKSLDEYVIVDQDRMHIDVYRGDQGPWAAQMLNDAEDVLELTCVSLRIPLREIYAGVDMSPPSIRDNPLETPDWITG